MVRWRIIQNALFSLLALALVLFGTPAHGDDAISGFYRAHVGLYGHQSRFPKMELSFFSSENVAIVEFAFRDNKKFDGTAFNIALNGVSSSVSAKDMAGFTRWDLRKGVNVLVVDIGRMKFDGVAFNERAAAISKRGRHLRVWTPSHHPVSAAQLYFVRAVDWFPLPGLRWVTQPAYVVTSRSVAFSFSSSDPTATVECRLDRASYRGCQSPAAFSGLSNGWHTFRARVTASNGKQGHGLAFSFYVYYRPPAVEIVSTLPSQSPTASSSMLLNFKVNQNWGAGSSAQCRLDGAAYKDCASPVTYSGVGRGDHKVDVRLSKSFFGMVWTSKPDSYSWTVVQDPPVVQWVSTGATLTNKTSATFTFQSPTATGFDCVLDGGSSQSCVSPWIADGVTEGSHTVAVTAHDSDGGISTPITYHWQVDLTPPVLAFSSIVPSQSLTNLNTLAVSYTVSEPAAVACSLDGTALATCASPLTLTGITQGSHALELSAVDTAGNPSSVLSYSWEADFTLPTMTVQMVSPTALPTNSTNAHFVFTSTKVSTFACSLDGAAAVECAANYSLAALGEGSHKLVVVPTDLAGNMGASVEFDWSIDLTAPVIQITSVTPSDAVTPVSSMSLAFQVSKAAAVTCEFDSGGAAPCASPYILNGLADGTHQVVLNAQDAAGNTAAATKYQWQVASPAVISINSYSPSAALSNVTSAVFSFSSAQSNQFQCALDTAAFSACSSPANYSGLSDGAHHFQVKAINSAGVAGAAASVSWTIDTVAPNVRIASSTPTGPVVSANEMVVAFSSDKAVSFTCALDGGAAQTCTSPMTWTALADGNHTASILGLDPFGNQSQAATYSWTVQTAPLTISGVSVQQLTRNSAVIRWTTSVPASGHVEYGQGGAFDSSTADVKPDSTVQSIGLSGLAPSSTYQARVKSTDASGRVVVSDPVSFTTLR